MTRLSIEARQIAVNLGYRIRPYDMLLDRRRWAWQPSGHQQQARWLRDHGPILDELLSEVRTYDEAIGHAALHRDHYGDDVITHDVDDMDGYLVCQDCEWGIDYVPIEDYDDGDDA